MWRKAAWAVPAVLVVGLCAALLRREGVAVPENAFAIFLTATEKSAPASASTAGLPRFTEMGT